jgi:hypothetical protein
MARNRLRFTTRGLLIAILAAALLLAGFVQLRDWRRRRAVIDGIELQIVLNQLAQDELRERVEWGRRGRMPAAVLQGYEEELEQLRRRGEELQESFARLQP